MIKLKTLLVEQEQENKYPADAPEHFGGGENIDILGYQTKHFDICKSAVTLYEKLKQNDEKLFQIFCGINLFSVHWMLISRAVFRANNKGRSAYFKYS